MDIRLILVQAFVILFAITVHEAAHAWTASKFGDPTAAALGRVSLNPLAHIDLFGTIIFPLVLILLKQPVFGWAKPVPYNPLNLRHPRKGGLWISFAGPIANIATATAAVLIFQVFKLAGACILSLALQQAHRRVVVILIYTAMINISPGRLQPHPHPAPSTAAGSWPASCRRRPPLSTASGPTGSSSSSPSCTPTF
jgi:Zn-dependent protease